MCLKEGKGTNSRTIQERNAIVFNYPQEMFPNIY